MYVQQYTCNKPGKLNARGPMLLACNHPNSFLDAIILCSLFKAPVYSLARGDVFKKAWAAKLLKSLNILPVYRTSEGVENLNENYKTFDACIEIFKKGGIVLIFSEGLCQNEWHFRPLKKGTARLAIAAWEQNIPLRILPTALNYSSFKQYGKNMHIFFGEEFNEAIIEPGWPHGKQIATFNRELRDQLQPLIYEIDPNDKGTLKSIFEKPVTTIQKALLALPAALGYLLHWPVFTAVNSFTRSRAIESGHYDSIIIGLLFFTYTIYLLLLFLALYLSTGSAWSLAVFILMPLLARCTLMLKKMVK